MTKKKKIIAIIIAGILSITLITTAILVIMSKKFKVTIYDDIDYINHTSGVTISLDSQYKNTTLNSKYQYGSELIQNNNNKYGLFSNISGQIIVGTNYDRYEILDDNAETNKTYFKFYHTSLDNSGFEIYDEHGNKTFATTKVDNYNTINTIEIKTKSVNIDKKYKIEEETTNIKVSDIYYNTTYYKEGLYHYESWVIVDTEGVEYTNLYRIEDGERVLIQTIGSSVGSPISDNIDFMSNIHFLKNGDPVFVSQEILEISPDNSILKIKIYDKDLELKNTVNINETDAILIQFRVENYLFIQEITQASEDNHDFAYDYMGERIYYNLTTHKINLKNGNNSEIKCDFVVNSIFDTNGDLNENALNPSLAIINGYIIEDKEISSPKLLLVDKQLKHSEIQYSFNTIEKISKNRYLASSFGEKYVLIDKNYQIIADFSEYNNIFTTEDNIIVSDYNYTYICNHDGIVLKKYALGSILNVQNKDFYMVLEENSENNTVNYRKGSNGQEFEIILTTCNSGNDTILENLSYNSVNTFIGEGYSYILASKINGSNTDYTIFNFSGDNLISFTLPSQYITPNHFVYDDHVIITIGNKTILLNK